RRRGHPASAPANRRDAPALLPVLPVEPPGGVPGLRGTRCVRARFARGRRGGRGADPAQSCLRRGGANGALGGRGGAQALVTLLGTRSPGAARRGAEAASAVARAALGAGRFDVVVIGGGIRLDPAQMRVLEALVNVLIRGSAWIGFNTSP